MDLTPLGGNSHAAQEKLEALAKGKGWSTQLPSGTQRAPYHWEMPYANPQIPRAINIRSMQPLMAKLDVLIGIRAIRSKLSFCEEALEQAADKLLEENWDRVLEYMASHEPVVPGDPNSPKVPRGSQTR
ncbi:hypothetical protein CEK28_08680 [Xenophilus sp. AP218F]|nr:hypothetical protein CEK28_08680 [Xenophilus sp. AP218F]